MILRTRWTRRRSWDAEEIRGREVQRGHNLRVLQSSPPSSATSAPSIPPPRILKAATNRMQQCIVAVQSLRWKMRWQSTHGPKRHKRRWIS
ncbi:uncharacterized protein M6B38_161550 [Iris pallida]|uniref:Uncharacterized protein n=1 Tax=Iris pallida TaxID=29817 RepID=A0AAX6EYF4_IRIPA|nr:uncharacterized protein M6B38_161550 [Iris pallida]